MEVCPVTMKAKAPSYMQAMKSKSGNSSTNNSTNSNDNNSNSVFKPSSLRQTISMGGGDSLSVGEIIIGDTVIQFPDLIPLAHAAAITSWYFRVLTY